MLPEILIVAGSYLLGSMPTALLVVRFATGGDVRELGSRNVGATNAMRSAGWRIGLLVSVVDLAKGAVPVVVMNTFNPASRWLAAAMAASVLGHCFSVWIRFKGGKGVATAFGAFVALAPKPALVVLVLWLLVLLPWRYPALASIVAAAVFPVVSYVMVRPPVILLGAMSSVCGLIIVRHAGNIRNLVSGAEPKIGGGER